MRSVAPFTLPKLPPSPPTRGEREKPAKLPGQLLEAYHYTCFAQFIGSGFVVRCWEQFSFFKAWTSRSGYSG
jgi:hypothetical protein